MEVTYDGRCFGCGADNADGLQMRFEPIDGESICLFRVPLRFQSWAGMVHGGLVALMLDEAVGWAAWHAGRPGVTGKLEVRYRQPLRLDDEVRVLGRIDQVRRTLVYASSSITRLADESVVAEASAVLMEARAEGRPGTPPS